MVPRTVVFDYSNFTKQVTVSVLAAHDFVQEVRQHHDVIHASVKSSDSLEECEAVIPARICGQAVSYDDFTGTAPVNVTIIDDDDAGLVITRIKPNATYNNYGTAQSYAEYDIALTSRPTKAVTVTVSLISP